MQTDKIEIPFNKPFFTGKELLYIQDAVASGKISGNGLFTKKCQTFFKMRFGFQHSLLTTSCTDALEMSAILANIDPGDEVIVPGYTFVSSANAFVLRGAKIMFCDSRAEEPNLDATHLESLITERTKAVVVVHYAGVACDMDPILVLAKKHGLIVIEDAAQSIDSYYKGAPLGSLGDLSAFSFHETKNIISGEGGLLVVNNPAFAERSEIIWEKGTNRSAFWRGEVDKYGWVDIGSSFLPSEVVAAFLYAQLECMETIQQRRIAIWNTYDEQLKILQDTVGLPYIPDYATNNAHMFYLLCSSADERASLIGHLKSKGIYAVFHYLGLHQSPYFQSNFGESVHLPNVERYENTLLRLPLYYSLSESEQEKVIRETIAFYGV
jgi:dTDP-4-amino-4,6-dideoxygalactose transaminase